MALKGLFNDLDPNHRFSKNKALVLALTFIAYATFHALRKSFSVVKSRLRDPEQGLNPFNVPGSGPTLLGIADSVFLLVYAVSMLVFSGPLADRANLRLFIPTGLLGSSLGLMMWALAAGYEINTIFYFLVAMAITGFFQSWGWPAVIVILSNWVKGPNRGLTMGLWNINTFFGNVLGLLIGGTVLEATQNWSFVFFSLALLGAVVSMVFLWFIQPSPSNVDLVVTVVNNQVLVETTEQRMHTVMGVNELQDLDEIDDDEFTSRASTPRTGPVPILSTTATSSQHPRGRDHVKHTIPRTSSTMSTQDDLDDLGSPTHSSHLSTSTNNNSSGTSLGSLSHGDDGEGDGGHGEGSITIWEALMVPGVLEFSFCLFFCKLISYTFLFWLPYYLANRHYEDSMASYLSIYFDLGSILGSIVCGYLDRYRKPGTTSASMLALSAPMLYAYYSLTSQKEPLPTTLHASLLLLLGLFITGPYSLITTAVAVDLGEHPSLGTSSKAMATVSGIIDGVGSFGAINSGLMISLITKIGAKTGPDGVATENWAAVFIALVICTLLGALLLVRIVNTETGHLGWIISFFGWIWYIFTCGGTLCGCSWIFSCCWKQRVENKEHEQDAQNNPSHKNHKNRKNGQSVTLELGEIRSNRRGAGYRQAEGGDLDSLGYVENPSDFSNPSLSLETAAPFAPPSRGKSPEEKYRKENKALRKEMKKRKIEAQKAERDAFLNGMMIRNDNYDLDEGDKIDIDRLYEMAAKKR